MTGKEENNEIRKLLRSLPAVKSGNDFLEKLDRKIATLEPERKSAKHFLKEKPGIFERTFGGIKSAWLAPALGLSAAVLFVFYITFLNEDKIVNEQKITNTKTEEKQEPKNTTGNTSTTEVSPSAVPENSEKKTENVKPHEKDITGNFDYKESEKFPARVEQNNKSLDQDQATTKKPKLNVAIPEGITKDNENKLNEEKSDNKNDEINNQESQMIEESRASSNEKKKMEDKSMKTPSEKMEEFENSIQKSIMDKLNAVNKANLENLRDKVNK